MAITPIKIFQALLVTCEKVSKLFWFTSTSNGDIYSTMPLHKKKTTNLVQLTIIYVKASDMSMKNKKLIDFLLSQTNA